MPKIVVQARNDAGTYMIRFIVSKNQSAFIPFSNNIREQIIDFTKSKLMSDSRFMMNKTVSYYKNFYTNAKNGTMPIPYQIYMNRNEFIKTGKYDKYFADLQSEINMINDWNENFEE